MMRQIASIILPVAAILILGGASKFEPQNCVTEYIHHATLAPTDFGNGVVAEHYQHSGYMNSSDYWGAKRIALVNCTSGDVLELTRTATIDGLLKAVNKEKQVERILRDGSGLKPVELFAFVENRAKKKRIPLKSWTYKGEACGCKVFYPALRGDKKKYEAEL